MLYEMLTGKHPFDPPDRMAMLSFHIVAPVPLMQDRAPSVEVPAMVEAVVRCLLEKDSKKRYANARALIEAIDGAAAGSGIDLGLGVPSAIPSQPGSRPGGPDRLSAESSPRGPDWGKDAFAKTSLGVPAANTTTANGDPALSPAPAAVRVGGGGGAAQTARKLLDSLGRLPRNVLFALAAGVPLAFILVIVLLILALRGPKVGPDGKPVPTTKGDTTEEAAAKAKAAPPDRVKAAVALGPEALETLVKEFPEDGSLLPKLAVAYQAQGKNADAMRTIRALLATDPKAAEDDDVVQVVVATATKGQGSDDDEAFALLEGPLGERGVDALIEMTVRGPGREDRDARDQRIHAGKSLAKPEVRAHASKAAAAFLELKGAQSCVQKRDVLSRVKDDADARVLPLLKQLKSRGGCGIFGRSDCWTCLRREGTLDDTIAAVEARGPTK
jgi:serine/threonine-protein kinase